LKLGIKQPWQPQSTEWQSASKLVATRKYQQALDVLEGLIVSWMFKLTKMNRSQTGKSFHKVFFFCIKKLMLLFQNMQCASTLGRLFKPDVRPFELC
jgi:hypothetical protein